VESPESRLSQIRSVHPGLQKLGPPSLNPKLFPVGWEAEVFMTSAQTRPGFAPRAITLGALAAGATAIGLLAIGWVSIGKLRFFTRSQSY
jgi:hypothetical protein